MTVLDPEKQKQAKEYSRIRRRLWLVDTIFSAVYFSAWLYFGWSILLRTWLIDCSTQSTPFVDCLSSFSNPWLLVPAFAFVFGGIYFILSLPLAYYSGFVLPHRFDQSNQNLKDWIVD